MTIPPGDVVTEFLRFAQELGGYRWSRGDRPCPHFATYREALSRQLSVEVLPDCPFLPCNGDLDLKRFSRYMKVAQHEACRRSHVKLVIDASQPQR